MNASPVALCPIPLWESLAREDASATFFQTPTWHRIAAAHFNRESGQTSATQTTTEMAPLLFEFPRAGEEPLRACLPLLRDRRWGRDRYFSPFGTYTALVCPRDLTASERAQVEARLATLNIHLAGSPFTRNPLFTSTFDKSAGTTGITRLPARVPALPSKTQVIDLTPEHADLPARDWDPDPRRRLLIARENRVTVRLATRADWDAYYNL